MAHRYALWVETTRGPVQVGSTPTIAEAERLRDRMVAAGSVGVVIVDSCSPDATAPDGQLGLTQQTDSGEVT